MTAVCPPGRRCSCAWSALRAAAAASPTSHEWCGSQPSPRQEQSPALLAVPPPPDPPQPWLPVRHVAEHNFNKKY